jgi:hypothetical protein
MDPLEQKVDGRVEKASDLAEPPDHDLPSTDRRKVLKLVLASAPVIITFTAGVARVDAADYTNPSGVSGDVLTAVDEGKAKKAKPKKDPTGWWDSSSTQ